jgi:hypothetical protein
MDAGRKELSMRASATPRSRRFRAVSGVFAVMVLALSGAAVSACGGGGATMPTMTPSMSPAAAASMAPGGAVSAPSYAPAADSAAIEAAWAARPSYVTDGGAMVMEAYRYALERPDVIQWMPCYCGCTAMGHRSNLDCFFRSRMAGGAVAFEEHASYCDVCVDTALLAKKRIAEGRTLPEIRAEVDSTFGGRGVPGTDTAVPQG